MALDFIQGTALLLALCFLHGVNTRLWRSRPGLGAWISGLFFGAICALGMLNPLIFAPGVIIDARSVVLSMAALFGGPVTALTAAAIAAATRLSIGGVGQTIGIMVIVLCAALGLAFRFARQRQWVGVGLRNLLLFGLLLHLLILALFQGLAPAVVTSVNTQLALNFVLASAVGTALLGWLLRDVEQRLETEAALADNVARLQAITRSIPDVVLLIDKNGSYLEVLTPHDDRLAKAPCDVVGKNIADFLPADVAAQQLEKIQRSLATGKIETLEYEIQTLSGLRQFEGRCQPLGDSPQQRDAVVFIARDRTERMLAETALRESEIRFRSLLRDIPSISVQGYLEDGTTVYWNRAAERLYGYSAEEAMGKSLFDLIIPAEMRERVQEHVAHMFATGEPIAPGELRLRHKNGWAVEVFSSHAYIQTPGQPPQMFCIDIDISGRKAAEEQARYLAFYDALTGLPNRRLFADRLEQAIMGNTRTGLCAAVLFLDLDHFKTLNDGLGHELGDRLLVMVAQRLQKCLRSQDSIARTGGDEFLILLQSLSGQPSEAADQVRTLGDKILEAMHPPYRLQEREHHLTASLGASMVCGAAPLPVEDLLKQADLALYRAKEAGRNTLCFFDPVMQASVNERLLLQTEMHRALRQGEFVLYYQPQVNVDGHITGAEVLLRWQHPEKGLIPPNLFIPLAEETGQIIAMGQWVLETALHQQVRWQQDERLAGLNLSINVSARQFRHQPFIEGLRQLLQGSGAAAQQIKLELTESLLLQDIEGVIALMKQLRALGLGLSLDDFGTGYSSLSYLKRLPLTQVKIDQGFVRHILHDPKDAIIAHSIIDLAQKMDLNVVAEGVETQAHYDFLRQHGCRDFQGYFFGRPMPLAAFEQQVLSQTPTNVSAKTSVQ